jgi:hypothetical protein
MKNKKQLGIWMDHSNAFIMELSPGTLTERTIVSESSLHDEEYSSEKYEKLQHTKEQHQQSVFYGKLKDIIRNYGEVVLFGPTDAKTELSNLIKADHLFSEIRIGIVNSDKLTKNQMHSFVKEYFK